MIADSTPPRVLTCLACLHDESPPFRLDRGPYDTSFDVAHPLILAYAQLLDQGSIRPDAGRHLQDE